MMTPTPEEYARSTWQVAPCLKSPGPHPVCVEYALLDSDPRPNFRERVARHPVPASLKDPHTVPPGNLTGRQAYLAALWDAAFRQVTGDRVYVLPDDRRSPVVTKAPDGTELVTTTRAFHAISSSGLTGGQWLVTKAIHHEGKALAWCLEVDTRIGDMVEVVMSRDNAVDLEVESQQPR